MSQYPPDYEDSFSEPVYPDAPERSWFGRNWLWFIPVVILLPIFCCCGGGGAMLWWGLNEMKGLPPYVDSVAAAQQDSAVQQALGTPIEVPTVLGFPNGGSFNLEVQNASRQFEAELPLVGSMSTGTLRIEAQSMDGVNWTYTVRTVTLNDGSGTVIDLMPAGSGSPTAPSPPDQTEDETEDDLESESP